MGCPLNTYEQVVCLLRKQEKLGIPSSKSTEDSRESLLQFYHQCLEVILNGLKLAQLNPPLLWIKTVNGTIRNLKAHLPIMIILGDQLSQDSKIPYAVGGKRMLVAPVEFFVHACVPICPRMTMKGSVTPYQRISSIRWYASPLEVYWRSKKSSIKMSE